MRILKVEFARLLARRAALVLLVAAVIVPTLIGVARVLDTRPPSQAEIAEAERMVAAESQARYIQRELERCLEKPKRYGAGRADDVQAACEERVLPQVDWYIYTPTLRLTEESKEGGGIAIVVVLSMLMLILGTTFAGHDWASGSMSNQLLFEPRRLRVWAAKATAVTVTAGGACALITTAWWLALAAVVSSRDGNASRAVVLDALQQGWRGAAVAAVAALSGYALAMLFRSTVASVAVIAGIAVAGGIVLAVSGFDNQWDPALNALAIVADGAKYWAQIPCPDGTQGCSEERVLTLAHGVATLGPATALAAVVSAVAFWRRDLS